MNKNRKQIRFAYTRKGIIEFSKFLYQQNTGPENIKDEDIASWFMENDKCMDILIPADNLLAISRVTAERIHNIFSSMDLLIARLMKQLPMPQSMKEDLLKEKNTFKRLELITEQIELWNKAVHST